MNLYQSLKRLFEKLYLYSLCGIDYVNERIFLLNGLKKWCHDAVRCHLFVLSGKCRHSGNCCHHIHVKYDKQWISTESDLNYLVQKNNIFSRFIPVYVGKKITYFNCSCLTQDNLCSAYRTRPYFCRQYPMSVLVADDYLHPGCGFYFFKKFSLPFFSTQALKQHIWVF